ncbi:hypothetical protein [Bartonella apihabitans]|uniref:hypothetical protein n=1 Tax=Bartonella apihabitans TaxID=2750929 RepID=UPI003BB657EF
MPLTTNADKQNDKPQQASESDEELIDFKKFYLYFGIGILFVSVMLSVTNYFFFEKEKICLWGVTFFLVVSADILILLPAIITKETNWFALLGSTVLCVVFLCLTVFYPFQDFQYRLKVISLVAVVATLLFVLLNSWINAAFFPSKNPNIRQSVDFVSNRFAVDVLNVTLILGTLFGTIAFLYFYPGQDNSTFFGGIDIKNVALATAGLVTFFWAAKATKNKSIDLEQKKREFAQRKQEFEQKKLEFEEKKRDGKRHDNEIAMAKRRDTAQLIAEASKLLSSENDAQKYAGLSFLNRVASDSEGTFRKEAFDILTDFIMDASDVTTANEVRMRAIHYAADLVGNNPDNFEINEQIIISCSADFKSEQTLKKLRSLEIANLYIIFIGFNFTGEFLFKANQWENNFRFKFVDCVLDGRRSDQPIVEIREISAYNCEFKYCKIFMLYTIRDSTFDVFLMENMKYFTSHKEISNNNEHYMNRFIGCDFSDSLDFVITNELLSKSIREPPIILNKLEDCFYYGGHRPFLLRKDPRPIRFLTNITSKQQFDSLFKNVLWMNYSPPKTNFAQMDSCK